MLCFVPRSKKQRCCREPYRCVQGHFSFVSRKELQRRKYWDSGFRLNAWLFSNAWITHELSHLQPDVLGYKYVYLLDL